MGFRDFYPLQTLKMKQRGRFGAALVAVAVDANERIADLDLAAENFAQRNSAQVIRVIEIGDEQLQSRSGHGARRRNVLDDGIEQRVHRAADVFQFHLGEPQLGAGVNHREIQLLVGRVERDE